MITLAQLEELLYYQDGKLFWRNPGKGWRRQHYEAGKVDGEGYRSIRLNYKDYLAHRLIWMLHHKEWPKYEIDHINQDRLDNRIENLRDVPRSINNKNKLRYQNNNSEYTGVHWHKATNKWTAQVRHDGDAIYLGVFEDKDDAASIALACREALKFKESHGG